MDRRHYASNWDAAFKVVDEIQALGSKATALQAELSDGLSGVKQLWTYGMNKDWLALPEAHAEAASMSAFGRVGTTEDVADVVSFLVSEETMGYGAVY
ncbi:hypothetical protein [Paenibacillus timonensis]|uniref:hypothetical protein n=1 Tax=Paenibacillus timonensis TaxID=225915 RepID=UPI003F977852